MTRPRCPIPDIHSRCDGDSYALLCRVVTTRTKLSKRRVMSVFGVFMFGFVIEVFENARATPNEPKLSHGPRWRGPCMAGGEGGGPEAGAVTASPVGCSAWLGVICCD